MTVFDILTEPQRILHNCSLTVHDEISRLCRRIIQSENGSYGKARYVPKDFKQEIK